LEGLRKGADYYIRKPFNPKELRSLVNIFLKKKGKKFDALTDLPDEKRLTEELAQLLEEKDSDIIINNLKISNLDKFSKEFGIREEVSIIRLVSQIIQDKVNEWESGSGFVGYIKNGEFIIGGRKQETLNLINEIIAEFDRVLPFIYQDYHIRNLDLGIEDIINPSKPGMLSLQHGTITLDKVSEKKEELTETKKVESKEQDLGSFTYEQLQQLVGSNNLDLAITRGPHGVAISVSKKGNPEN
ncbi:hypothetical protein HY570_03800, partial [Candidatus Micrarchaeota archaeon]|nr:hypothetical protein [Candidatus Micrarchaeota archaeon]